MLWVYMYIFIVLYMTYGFTHCYYYYYLLNSNSYLHIFGQQKRYIHHSIIISDIIYTYTIYTTVPWYIVCKYVLTVIDEIYTIVSLY